MSLPKIGLTLGDPCGIGPEIVIRLIQNFSQLPPCHLVIFGQKKIIESWAEILAFPQETWDGISREFGVTVQESGKEMKEIKPGYPSAESGQASFSFFKEAIEAAQKGEIQAVVTGPISKASWQMAGIKFRGHTEFLESLFSEALMSFWSERLRLVLFTHHLPLTEAVARVKKKALLEFFLVLERNLKRWNMGVEELLVCGLNPHAGEEGTIGLEETTEIIPAIVQAQSLGLQIEGPFPPDTIFLKALDQPQRMVVCLYHDQALIPFKLLSFDSGVNLTLGLPFIRTSPDHGTAFDLAGKGVASPRSFREAIWLAWRLLQTG